MNTENKNLSSLETKIGLYWLHKLGVASLVFGVVFLITYSIQLCANPFLESMLKLGSGLIVSIALLFLGRKMSAKEDQKWYGHGLTAGGWSLAYFTAYAAHYIPDVRVISSLPVEMALLALVAFGSLWSALKSRSELMAIYSITLASITIVMNGPGLFSDISFLIIAITASVLGNSQSWRKLFAYALASCYIGHFFCSFHPSTVLMDGTIATAFLFTMWLIFSIGIGYSMRVPDSAKNFVTSLACINALVLASGLALTNTDALSNLHQTLFVVAGVLYLGTSKWLETRKIEQQQIVHSLLGLFFVNAAKCMHFTGLDMLTVDVLQIALLAIVGLKFQIKSFQWVAVVLSAILLPVWMVQAAINTGDIAFGFNAFEYVRLGIFAAASLAALTYLHIREAEDAYSYFYHLAANLMCAVVFVHVIDPSWQALAFTLLAVANIAVGAIRNSDYYSVIGLIPLLVSIGMVAMNIQNWLSTPIALLTGALFVGHGLGTFLVKEKRSEWVDSVHWLCAYVGTILLTLLVLIKAPADYTSLGLGVEGIVLVVAGFFLKESFFRFSGLAVLALLTGKLLFIDLAHYDTFARILSFIGAGVVFLLSSYAYGRFTQFDGNREQASDSHEEEVSTVIPVQN